MTALGDQNGAQSCSHKKAIVTHSGCCLSPRLREFLCGTPRTVLTQDAFDEDVLLSILPERLIVTALQDTGKNAVLLFLGDACLSGQGPLLSLAYRLNGEAHTLPVWGKAGKVQMLPKALTSGQGAAGDVVCRLLLSGRHFLLVHRLALVLLPQLSRLLADVEAHPGFLPAMPEPADLLHHLRTKGLALTCHPKGVLVSYLDTEGREGRAVITVDVAHACLELCDAEGRGQGQPVGTLDAALATLPKQQTAKSKRAVEIFDVHADDGSLSVAPMPERTIPELPLKKAVEAAPAAAESAPAEPAPQEAAICRVEEASPAPADPRIVAAISSIREGRSAEQLREALLEVLDDEIRGPADWADAWVEHGLLGALVHRAGAAGDGGEDGDGQTDELIAQAAVAALSAASDDADAAQCMVGLLRGALVSGLPGLVLLRLLLAVTDLPAVCKVAMTSSLGNAIGLHLEALSAAAAPVMLPGEVPVSDRTGITDDSAFASFRSPTASQRSQQAPATLLIEIPDDVSGDKGTVPHSETSSKQITQATSAPISVPVSSSKPAFVPKLMLPASQSPGALIGGLTRSTRRNFADPRHGSHAGTPLARTQSPAFGTPPTSFREEDEILPVTASAELSALGSALGESLVAADLATIISHKRQATLRRAPSSALALHLDDHSRSLDAHRILLTARSSSSAVSPRHTARGSSLGSPAGRLQRATSRLISHRSLTSQQSLPSPHAPSADEEGVDSQRMCMLLEALLAVAPLVAECAALRSPTRSIVTHLIARTTASAAKGVDAPCVSERQRKLSIAVLHYFAAEVPRGDDIIHRPSHSVRGSQAAVKGTPGCPPEKHTLVQGVVAALSAICTDSAPQALSAQSLRDASALLDLLHDYLVASPAPSLPVLLHSACSAAVRDLQRALMACGPLHSWRQEALAALQALLRLDTALLQRCQDACLGRELIAHLVVDRRAANFRADVVRTAAQLFEHGASDLASLLVACLDQYTALAGLLGRQPAAAKGEALHAARAAPELESAADADAASCDGGKGSDILVKHAFQSDSGAQTGSQRGTGLDMSRMEALKTLAFLVDSPKGVAVRLLSRPASAHSEREQSGPEVRAALRLLATVWGAPGNPFLGSKHAVDLAVHLHFLHFAKLFHGRSTSETTTVMCRLHLEVLRAMVRSTSPTVRRRFYQLRVMDLLVRELSLEYEAAQQARLPPPAARVASAGSNYSSSPPRPAGPQGDSGSQKRGLGSPFQNKAGQPFRVPPLQLSPSPSATALDLRGLAGHSTPPRGAESCRSDAVTAREASFGSLTGGQDAVPPLSTHGSRPPTAGKPPLCSSRRGAAGRGSPARSSRLAASQRPSSAPSSGRPFAAPAGGIPPAATPRLGRANTAVPRLLLQGALLHGAPSGTYSPSDEGSQTAGSVAADTPRLVQKENTPGAAAEVLWCSESVAGDGSASESSADDDSSSSSSDCESEASGGGTTRRQTSPRQDAAPSKPAAPFQFSGDLDADVAALEALEDGSSYYACDTQRTCSSTGWTPRPNERLPAGTNVPKLGAVPQRTASGEAAGSAPVPQLNLMGSLRLSQHSSSDQTPSEKGCEDAPEGGLGSLEQMGLGMGKMQAAMEAHASASDAQEEPVMVLSYSEERARRVLYQDKDLQLLVLEVVLELLLDASGQLEALYCSHQPLERRQQNIPHLLHHHLNHPSNAALAAPLLAAAARIGPGATRLLRLLCSSLFQHSLYSHRRRLARGAYAQVYASSFTETGVCEEVALKVIDIPSSIHDPCCQVDVFSEVSILERFRGQQAVCQLLNYGLEGDSIVMVMRKYAASLKAWRARITSPPTHHLRLYLHIFANIIAAKQVLALDNVVHFDLKCDNVLLEPVAGASEADLWRPASARPPFRIVLADFGESRMYASADGAVTVRNRGTEYVKSPEMLLVGNAQRADRHGFDRRRRKGAGPPADVWALGCLLFELLTGDFLFYDPDWIRFFVRLAQPGQELIPAERLKAVADLPGVVELLEYMLVRDPCRRPSLSDVALRVDQMLRDKKGKLPPHQVPETSAAAAAAAGGWPAHAGAGGTDVTPKQQQLLQPAVSNASELSLRYSLAEHYLTVLTPLTDRLLIGCKEALAGQDALRQHCITHVLLLCCGPQSAGEGSGAASEDGAGCLEWVLSDAGLTAAIANCTAAEAVCRVVPLGPLPCGPDSDDQGSEEKLLEAMPSMLDFIHAAEAAPSRRASLVAGAASRSGADLVRRRMSSSSSDGEGGTDSFAHLPGHVPSSADRPWRTNADGGAREGAADAHLGPASARAAADPAAAAGRDGARSTPVSARGAGGSRSAASVGTAQRWLRAQGRQAGSPAAGAAGTAGQRGARQGFSVGELQGEGGRVLVAAAAGYEGEAAVVAIAHIMRQGLTPHEALVAASQRHVALHLQDHNRRQLAAWAKIATR